MTMDNCDVAIVGAGPYGLASAAHLGRIKGLDVRVFGDPMSFWRDRMPAGMLLRSPYVASHISDPDGAFTLDAYQRATSPVASPVPLDRFVDYGRWFQRLVLPHPDPRAVDRVQRTNGHFRLDLADGDAVSAGRVVVAAGIAPFARIPGPFQGLPDWAASHSSAHRDLTSFADRSVMVVGGGQSALESAALLHEAGARVQVLVRAPRIYFLRRVGWVHNLGPLTRLMFAPAEVGPAGVSQFVQRPDLYRRLPRALQDKWAVRSIRPAGAAWLAARLGSVPIRTDTEIVSVSATAGNWVTARLRGGTTLEADHVLMATGYRVDVAGYSFLEPVLERIGRVGGYPRLSRSFESSLPGLHFVGAPAAWSFGPLMRFVAGTEFAAAALARGMARRSSRPLQRT
jgi:cation diffusion facilitator CzcD-associated flavoprotein CzcO